MTKDEAIAVVAIVRSGAVPQEFPASTIEAWEDDLAPLPFESCQRAALQWKLSTPTDEHGKPVPKFVSEPGAVLTACGVPYGARHLLGRALQNGGAVFPSLRGALADGGWEYVPTSEPLPRGVAEWYANAGLPLPAGWPVDPALEPVPVRPALPSGDGAHTPEQVRANVVRLRGLSRRLADAKRAGIASRPAVSPATIEADLQAFEARRTALERGGR